MGGENVSQSIQQWVDDWKNTKAHEKLEFDQKCFIQVLMQGKHTQPNLHWGVNN